MMENTTRLTHLWQQYAGNTASLSELEELKTLLNDPDNDKASATQLLELLRQTEPLAEHSEIRLQALLQVIRQTRPLGLPLRRVPVYRGSWWAAAAILLLLLGAGTWFWFTHRIAPSTQAVVLAKDIAPPATVTATITLGNGSKIDLGNVGADTIAVQGKVSILEQGKGGIVSTGKSGTITYNTLNVPRGSKPFTLQLADGSRVWLNTASSITYPTAFRGSERKVTLDGEAYFEIAKNASMPFYVQHNDLTVKVLGTHFNINSYNDEATLKITLLEGAVQVVGPEGDSRQTLTLQPGQQAILDSASLRLNPHPDLDETMAWKNGSFYFDGVDIRTVMRQVQRWYNVDVRYQSEIPASFVAKISRDVKVSELLNILELTNLVHFKIEGNKITVMR
jgi:transmembrane sensor